MFAFLTCQFNIEVSFGVVAAPDKLETQKKKPRINIEVNYGTNS